MVKRIKERIKEWIINKLIEWLEIESICEAIDEVDKDVGTAHNEFHDLEDSMEAMNRLLEEKIVKVQEEMKSRTDVLRLDIAILRDGGTAVTPAKIIDEWFNGEEVESDG